MVAGSLDVERNQVDAREGNASVFKQVVGDFARDELVEGLHWSGRQAADQLVDHGRVLGRRERYV